MCENSSLTVAATGDGESRFCIVAQSVERCLLSGSRFESWRCSYEHHCDFATGWYAGRHGPGQRGGCHSPPSSRVAGFRPVPAELAHNRNERNTMPTYCVSDLHLCDRGPRDNFCFRGSGAAVPSFLNLVERNRGRLLILGDLFDWWQVPVGSAVTAYLPLLDRLAQMGATWIVGNHDNALAPLDRHAAHAGPSVVEDGLPPVRGNHRRPEVSPTSTVTRPTPTVAT